LGFVLFVRFNSAAETRFSMIENDRMIMSATSLLFTRRQLLATTAAAGAVSVLPGTLLAAGDDTSLRPFQANVSDEALADLRRRLQATRWPDKETVADASQGAQLANLQDLVRYWATDYDWRKGEVKLNAFPQFMTGIDSSEVKPRASSRSSPMRARSRSSGLPFSA